MASGSSSSQQTQQQNSEQKQLHKAKCLFNRLNMLSFSSLLDYLPHDDWFNLLIVCSCCDSKVRRLILGLKQLKISDRPLKNFIEFYKSGRQKLNQLFQRLKLQKLKYSLSTDISDFRLIYVLLPNINQLILKYDDELRSPKDGRVRVSTSIWRKLGEKCENLTRISVCFISPKPLQALLEGLGNKLKELNMEHEIRDAIPLDFPDYEYNLYVERNNIRAGADHPLNEAMEVILDFDNLTRLSLSKYLINKNNLRSICERKADTLEILDVFGCFNITRSGFRNLKQLKNLQRINFRGTTLHKFKFLPQTLRMLIANECWLDEDPDHQFDEYVDEAQNINDLAQHLPNLRVLELHNSNYFNKSELMFQLRRISERVSSLTVYCNSFEHSELNEAVEDVFSGKSLPIPFEKVKLSDTLELINGTIDESELMNWDF